MKRAKVWFVTSADGMPSRSLYPSQKWQTCGKSRRSTNLEITLLSSHVHTYAGTNRAGIQKDPVTLRDSTNEGGGSMLGSVIVQCLSARIIGHWTPAPESHSR